MMDFMYSEEGSGGSGSVGRAAPCQGAGRGFEPRLPLQFFLIYIEPQRASYRSQVLQLVRRHLTFALAAVTIASATERLRENSVYLDPSYATPAVRRLRRSRGCSARCVRRYMSCGCCARS